MYKIVNWCGVECIHVYNLSELEKDMEFVGYEELEDKDYVCPYCGCYFQKTIYLYKSKWTGKIWKVTREWFYECINCGAI